MSAVRCMTPPESCVQFRESCRQSFEQDSIAFVESASLGGFDVQSPDDLFANQNRDNQLRARRRLVRQITRIARYVIGDDRTSRLHSYPGEAGSDRKGRMRWARGTAPGNVMHLAAHNSINAHPATSGFGTNDLGEAPRPRNNRRVRTDLTPDETHQPECVHYNGGSVHTTGG